LLKEHGVEVLFEKEAISTFDSKGELLITIMASLAQQESQSLSQNVTWGKQRAMEEGKIRIPYKRFLGYKKGADGLPEIVPEEAKVVRLIYSRFLAGGSSNSISKQLMAEGVPAPMGGARWSITTIMSILRNETYKGDKILQKNFTVDFLTGKKKKNEGEKPSFYLSDSHPAIIPPEEWQAVQDEIERRKGIGRPISSHSPFAMRLKCGNCDAYFGSKLLHSNSKYRRTVWRCNLRYSRGSKCDMPHITEDTIMAGFVEAFNGLLNIRKWIAQDCNEALSLLEATDIDDKIAMLECTVAELEEQAMSAIQSGGGFESHLKMLDDAKLKIMELEAQKAERTTKHSAIRAFIKHLEREPISGFDEQLWTAVIDYVVVNADGELKFHFKGGVAV
jgi:hypothetical protein